MISESFSNIHVTLAGQACIVCITINTADSDTSALHFLWSFQMLWHNTAGVSTLSTILPLFDGVFHHFGTIQHWLLIQRCSRYEQRQKNNAEFKPWFPIYIQHNLDWLNRCLLSKGILQQSKVSNSSVCWTSKYCGSAAYLQVLTVHTDQHHTVQRWWNCWGHQQSCSSRPPVFVDSWQ